MFPYQIGTHGFSFAAADASFVDRLGSVDPVFGSSLRWRSPPLRRLPFSRGHMMAGKKGFFTELRRNWALFLMLLPTLVFFAIHRYAPMLGIYSAFTRFEFPKGIFGSPFVGMQNFVFLWKSQILLKITKNTILYHFAFIIIGNALQILSAILITCITNRICRRLAQSLMFLPYFVSFVLIGVLTYNILNYEMGSFSTIIYLAAIMSIPTELYEAAEIYGANVFRQIRHITILQLIPTMIILFLLPLGNIMRGQFELFFDMVYNNGILFDVTGIIDTYVYRSLKTNFDVGMATAVGLYQSVFGFIIMVTNSIIKRKREEYALF
jgi:putative aldouronate transport system permease protein